MIEKAIFSALAVFGLGNVENKNLDISKNKVKHTIGLSDIDISYKQERNGLEIRVLKMKELTDEDEKIKRFQFGRNNDQLDNGKLIFVGETGSGKTTLVNSIVNNLLDVKFEDNVRYSLFDLNNNHRSESESQTDCVTEYTINYIDGMKRPCNFVFVDTPGLEDTRGEQIQKENMKQILTYISEGSSKVGLVIQSSISRLTAEQKSILLDMKTLIDSGKIESLYILSTFADNDSPNVKDVLDGFNIPYKSLYLFNNNALYSRNYGIPNNDLRSFKMNWNASNKSIEKLLDFLKPDVKREEVTNTSMDGITSFKLKLIRNNCNGAQIYQRCIQ